MDEKEKIILQHQMEVWKTLTDYIHQMDMGYQNVYMIVVGLFTGIVAFINTKKVDDALKMCVFFIPIATEIILAYVCYQFRITAILRGYLAYLEKKINESLNENVYMCHSALVEMYMSKNNLINSFMMVPTVLFTALLAWFCFNVSQNVAQNNLQWLTPELFMLYWIMIAVFAILILLPFLNNEKIRKEIRENGDKTYENYEKNIEEEIKKKLVERKYKKEALKVSIKSGILVFIFGFLLMFMLWEVYSNNKYFDVDAIKGFFDYYAATIGDGICLTMVVAFGEYFIKINEEQRRKVEKAVDAYQGIEYAAFATGVIMQVKWLVSSETELNWTFKRLHMFNLAGWYHAVFFCIMFGVIAYIARKEILLYINTQTIANGMYVASWGFGTGYWFTHIIDDYLTYGNYVSWIIGSALVWIMVFSIIEKVAAQKQCREINRKLCCNYGIIVCGLATVVIIFCVKGMLGKDVLEVAKMLVNGV